MLWSHHINQHYTQVVYCVGMKIDFISTDDTWWIQGQVIDVIESALHPNDRARKAFSKKYNKVHRKYNLLISIQLFLQSKTAYKRKKEKIQRNSH